MGDAFEVTPPAQCICPTQQRSIWNIVWSCLATIFACSWVSVHPNIPPPGAKWWKGTLHRLELMFWAIIAPEMIILWAMRQWVGARELERVFRAAGWTKTHGYFIQMGGFTLYEGEECRGVLDANRMIDLLSSGKIELPKITEEEIRDRSKGDSLSKALVIIQTSWFVMQCIARHANGLDLAELELVTAAFAVLNCVMYFLWWNKPLDVRCSVPIELVDEGKPMERFDFYAPSPQRQSIFQTLVSMARYNFSVIGPFTLSCWNAMKPDGLHTLRKFVMFPWTIFRAILSRPFEMSPLVRGSSTFTVYEYYQDQMRLMMGVWASIIATIFGAIHCAGWVFLFSSHTESILWRICSVIITVVPFYMILSIIMSYLKAKNYSLLTPEFDFAPSWLFIAVPLICIPFYIVSRFILLTDAILTLHNLPPSAFQVVQWVTFLPHI